MTRTRREPGRARPLIALFLVTLAWGWSFVWIKQALDTAAEVLPGGGGTPVVALFLTLRFGLAAVVTWLLFPSARRSLDRAAWFGGAQLGITMLVGFVLQMRGLEEVTPPVSAFLTSLYVPFTAILMIFFRRRKMALLTIVGAALATFGAGFISGPPQVSFGTAEWLTVGCAFVFGIHILVTDRVTRRCAPMAVTFTSFCWVTVGSVPLLFASLAHDSAPEAADLVRLTLSPGFGVPLLWASLVATVMALSLMNRYQRDVAPMRAAILYALEPVWAAMISIALHMEEPGTWLFVGGASLVAGNILAEYGAIRSVTIRREENRPYRPPDASSKKNRNSGQ